MVEGAAQAERQPMLPKRLRIGFVQMWIDRLKR
jgi:hypothetical protein